MFILLSSKALLKGILTCTPHLLPETGGILGGMDGIITTYLWDKGMASEYGCSYTPNTKSLNEEIKKWEQKKISFMGIFHTHFHGVRTLSPGDKRYITNIMRVMPDNITKLYFPIVVFPQEEMVAYVATHDNGEITITEDAISILD